VRPRRRLRNRVRVGLGRRLRSRARVRRRLRRHYHYRPLRATTGAGTCGVLLVRTGPVGAAHDNEHMCERWVEAWRGADHRARDL